MKIRFIYHKGKDSFVGKVITFWTGFLALFYNWRVLKYSYSHEEIWFADEDGIFIFNNIGAHLVGSQYAGQCFSSTTRGKWKGVRLAPASVVLKHPDRWDYIEVEVDPERLEVVIEEANKLMGKKYDYWGLFGFLQPLPIHHKKQWYCSELCDWFKYMCRIIPKRHKRISPRRAAYILSKRWGEPKPLV